MRRPGIGRISRLATRMRRQFTARGVILMYHRIAERDSDPWGLAVSPAHFSEHLQVLRTCRLVSLPDFAAALGRGQAPRRAVIVTFDDGYADNFVTANTLLQQHDIPATVFLTTGAIGSQRELWWDELERVLLQPHDLPAAFELRRANSSDRWELGSDATYTNEASSKNRSWRAWEAPPTARHVMYADLWRRLYPLPHDQKRALLDELLDWAGLETRMRLSHRLLSLAEAKQLGHTSRIEIGAHTVTHPPLPELPLSDQTHEIRQSKRFLEETLNRPVSCFSYPHGHYDPGTMSIVREAGFRSACTTDARTVSKQSECLALPRVQVMDWSGDEFRRRLRGWLSAEPHP
jgi:peptidoglycan/xylan/chitin deacetylase (PgdA/CDA1 family)